MNILSVTGDREKCSCTRNGGIDEDIKPIVDALNSAGIKTMASCCGHTNQPSTVALEHNGVMKEIRLLTYEQARLVGRLFPDINGERPGEQIFELVAEEQKRQEEILPVPYARLLPEGETPADHKRKLARYRAVNDNLEHQGEHDALHVALEVLFEFFTAETKEEHLAKAVHNIAYWCRIYETEAAK